MKTIITGKSFDYLGDDLSNELDIKKADVKIDTFDDSWPNIKILEEDVKNKVAFVLLDFSQPKDFFINYALLQGLIDYKVESLNIIMPYFPVGTMERKGKPGEVATAHSFARILSTLPTGKSGRKNNLYTFDIHAEVEEYLFNSNNINIELLSMFGEIGNTFLGKSIAYPDAGAAKRFSSYLQDNPKIICNKKRIGDKRIIEIMSGDVKGKDIIIMDDLIQSGGTIIEASKLIRENGAKSISAYSTHGVFPNDSHKNLVHVVDKLYVTDSIPQNISRASNIENMEIISIKQQIKQIIQNY